MSAKRLGFLFILLAFGLSLMSYQMLPNLIPIHWNMNGQADRFEQKIFGAFLLPLIMFILFAFIRFLPRIDPRKENYVRFTKTFDLIMNGIILLLFLIHVMTLSYSLGWLHNTSYFIHITLGVFFIFLGNYMPKIRQNYFVGIRTPWAITSEEVWRKTHRLGGKIFVGTGFLFIGIIFLPTTFQGTASIILLVASIIITYISSYIFFLKIKK